MRGGTISRVSGEGFTQDGVCNLTVRYGPLQQKVSAINDTDIDATSPEAYVPDAVVISVSLNGQQFISDKTLHYRDVENTFTYYQDLFVHDYSPKSGPISGKTKIKVTGMGFSQFKDESAKVKIPDLWVRFRDATTENLIGSETLAFDVSQEEFSWRTPSVESDTRAILEYSFNRKDWSSIIAPGQNYSYQYFNAPHITSISP